MPPRAIKKDVITHELDRNARSNRRIFIPRDSGSPKDGLLARVSGLGQIARLDFDRYNVAGEVIFRGKGRSHVFSTTSLVILPSAMSDRVGLNLFDRW